MAFTPLGYIPLVVINATIIHIPVILGALFCGPKKGGFLGFLFGLTSFIKNTVMPATPSAFVFSPVLAAGIVGTKGIIYSALICFVPRILVGVVSYFVYVGVKKLLSSGKKNVWSVILNLLIAIFLIIGANAFIQKVSGTGSVFVGVVPCILVGVVVFAALTAYTAKKSLNISAFIYAGVLGSMVNTLLVMGGIFVLYKDAYAEALSIDPATVLGVIGGVISFNGVIEAIVASIIVAAVGTVLIHIKPIGGKSEC
jgi:uncharacterized membrane protein